MPSRIVRTIIDRRTPLVVTEDVSVESAVALMAGYREGAVMVVRNGCLIGYSLSAI